MIIGKLRDKDKAVFALSILYLICWTYVMATGIFPYGPIVMVP